MLNRIFATAVVKRLLKLDRDATIDVDSSVATAAAGAATLHRMAGVVTSEALTTAAGADYTLTLTNNKIKAGDLVFVSVDNGTNTTAPIYASLVTPANGSVAIKVRNGAAAAALNGTIKVTFIVFKS